MYNVMCLEQYTVYIQCHVRVLQNSDSTHTLYMVNVITLDFTTQTFTLHRYYTSYICTCHLCSTCTVHVVHVAWKYMHRQHSTCCSNSWHKYICM